MAGYGLTDRRSTRVSMWNWQGSTLLECFRTRRIRSLVTLGLSSSNRRPVGGHGRMLGIREGIVSAKGVLLTVLDRVTTGWSAVKNPLRRSRFRWFMLGWIIAIPTVLVGGGLFIAGEHIIVAKGAFAIYGKIPGGLHTHGFFMLLIGMGLVMGLSSPLFGNPEPRVWLRIFLWFDGFYYAWSGGMLAMAPLVKGGQFSYLATILFFTIAALPAVLLVGPPPQLVPRDENDILRAAIKAGVTPDQARVLVEYYLHGGEDAAG